MLLCRFYQFTDKLMIAAMSTSVSDQPSPNGPAKEHDIAQQVGDFVPDTFILET